MKHKRRKVPISIRKPVIPRENFQTEVKNEIEKLEQQRDNAPKGFRGIIQKMSLNKQISDRRKFLNTDRKVAMTKKQIEITKSRVELENEREKLKQIQSKRQVNFDDLGGISYNKKKLSIEDLY